MVLTFLKVTAQAKVMENYKNSLEKIMESHEIWRAQKGTNSPWVRSPLLLVTLASIFVFSHNAPPQQLRQKWLHGDYALTASWICSRYSQLQLLGHASK